MNELRRFKLSLRSCPSSNFHINMLSNSKGKEITISQVKGNYEHNLCYIEINHLVIASSSPVLKVSSKSMADEGDYEAVIEKGVDSSFGMLILIAVEQITCVQKPRLKKIPYFTEVRYSHIMRSPLCQHLPLVSLIIKNP